MRGSMMRLSAATQRQAARDRVDPWSTDASTSAAIAPALPIQTHRREWGERLHRRSSRQGPETVSGGVLTPARAVWFGMRCACSVDNFRMTGLWGFEALRPRFLSCSFSQHAYALSSSKLISDFGCLFFLCDRIPPTPSLLKKKAADTALCGGWTERVFCP